MAIPVIRIDQSCKLHGLGWACSSYSSKVVWFIIVIDITWQGAKGVSVVQVTPGSESRLALTCKQQLSNDNSFLFSFNSSFPSREDLQLLFCSCIWGTRVKT